MTKEHKYIEKNGFYQTKKGLWGIAYTDHTGKRIHKVVGASLSIAKQKKRELEAEVAQLKANPQLIAQQKTVNDVADKYINNHLKNLKAKSNLSMFNRFRDHFGKTKLADINPLNMTQYYHHIAARTSYSTANRQFSVVSKFFTELKKWGLYFGENPCIAVNKKIAEPFEPHPLSKEEIAKFMPHLADYIKPAIKFCLMTGVRKKELVGLRWEDIDFNAKTILLRETKTQKSRMLGLIPSIEEILTQIGIQKTGIIFPLRDWQLRYQVSHAAKKAGLGHVRVHDLRHSFAVNFLNNDGKLHDLQILMGHSSIKTTQRYMKFKKEEVAQKMIVMNDMFLGMAM